CESSFTTPMHLTGQPFVVSPPVRRVSRARPRCRCRPPPGGCLRPPSRGAAPGLRRPGHSTLGPAGPARRHGPARTPAHPAMQAADAIVCGPGLGLHGTAGVTLDAVLDARDARPLVLDADALNLLAPFGSERRAAGAVLTPHPGEAARLLGTDVPSVQRDRQAAAVE